MTEKAVSMLQLSTARPHGKRLPKQDWVGKQPGCRPRGRRAGTRGTVGQPKKIHFDDHDEGSIYVMGKVEGKDFKCLLDIGATKPIISPNVYLNHPPT